ncbi:MAG: hypothetical protein U9R69_06265 [Thermodesulfobacteriota bacterium]|nr:hypothetical protein [Thermodesulfobacteriota bacterium]
MPLYGSDLRFKLLMQHAAVLAGFRQISKVVHPDRMHGFIAEIGKLVGDDVRSMLVARQPEWLHQDMDYLSRMFDGFKGAREQ